MLDCVVVPCFHYNLYILEDIRESVQHLFIQLLLIFFHDLFKSLPIFLVGYLKNSDFYWSRSPLYILNTMLYLFYILYLYQFSSVQSLSRVQLFATPWVAARQASLSFTNSWIWLKLMPIESVMPSSHLILCRPLHLLHSIPPSIRVFSKKSTLCMRWPKYWSFSFNISPSNEHPGLIAFRMDCLDLLAVQGTGKSSPTPQFKSINFSALSFLHSPTLTSIHDHWKNHSFD